MDSGERRETGDSVVSSDTLQEADRILASMPNRGVPVTVLTGFLGAGKTTVLNYILRAPHGLRIAVLVNEFGDIDIDSQLIGEGDMTTDSEVILKNGCICCTISNSFVEAVHRLLERQHARPHYLIIETTGAADPIPILANLQETELDDVVYVDQVLTVVDALNFKEEYYCESSSATSQIKAADTILISKCDLVDGDAVTDLISRVTAMRPKARIIRSQRGQIPLRELFDLRMGVSEISPSAPSPTHNPTDNHDHCSPPSLNDRNVSNHLSEDGFTATSFTSRQPFDLTRFRSEFLNKLPAGVFRSKGLLWFDRFPLRFIFQLSGRRFEIEKDAWPENQPKSNQIVIIGKDFSHEQVLKQLKLCLCEETQDMAIIAEPGP